MLTAKEQRFVAEYEADPCATRAAARAGYSVASARKAGSNLLAKPHIKEAIELAQNERRSRLGISADRVIGELVALAFSDVRDVAVDKKGRIQVAHPDSAKAIQELHVEFSKVGRRESVKAKIKMYSKQAALVSLAQHLGLLNVELPALEVLLNRLPPNVQRILRTLMANPGKMPVQPITDQGNES